MYVCIYVCIYMYVYVYIYIVSGIELPELCERYGLKMTIPKY